MSAGYAGKILRLNLANRSVDTIETSQYEEWGGGHGMGSAIFWDLCQDKAISGFNPGNVITIMADPLSGTLAPSSGRCEVQGIGPQGYPVEWFTRSNFGGRFAGELKYAGWDGIVIVGRADSPVWVNIINDQVTFQDASGLWGLNTTETQERIWREVTGNAKFGEWLEAGEAYTTRRPAVLCISQAGERLSRVAVLLHDAGSAAGQGGFGAVFGAKNLKAISVMGTGGVKVAAPQALLESWLWHRDTFQYNVDSPRHESPKPNWPAYFTTTNSPAAGPVTRLKEPYRPQACQACGMACRRRTSSGRSNDSGCMPTIWPVRTITESQGSRISEDRLCVTDLVQDYGLNVFELYAADFYLRKLYQMGILGPGKAIECDLPFDSLGTLQYIETYIRKIAYREGIGDILADGVVRAAEKWGRYKEDTDSGLLEYPYWGYMEHFDPRLQAEWSYGSILGERDINEHGITHAVHGLAFGAKISGVEPVASAERVAEILSSKVLPYEGDPFMFDYSEGPTGIYSASMAKTVAWHRHYSRFWSQSIGLCDFVWPDFINVNAPDMLGATPEGEPKFFNAVTGKGMSFVDGIEIGRKTWNLDRAIWVLQGRHRDMEVHSGYVYTVPVTSPRPSPHLLPVYENGEWKYSECLGRTLDKARFEEWKTKYFELEGWDTSSGWPTKITLEELGLGKVADELQNKRKLGVRRER
jgi:aldehyde:ferredoxin oxidoreductase